MNPLIPMTDYETASDAVKREYDDQIAKHGRITNMKRTMLHDVQTFKTYMDWYTMYDALKPVFGDRALSIFSYAISTGNVKLQIIAEADSTGDFATPYGFAVKKGSNPELLQKFNDGLKNVKQSGKYDEIINKYVSRS